MKRDLIWGWTFAILAIVMLCFTFYGFYIGNDFGAIMCFIAAGIDIVNAVMRFHNYQRRKEWAWYASFEKLDEGIKACWPDEDDDESEDTAGILSSGSFIDD